MLPGVRIEDIEAAIEVTECCHFSRAGEKLHRAQATISKSIKRVEREMGVVLVDRKTHPIRLTKAGKLFRYHARRALDSLERGIHEAARASESGLAVLKVGYTSYLDLDVLGYLEHLGKSPEFNFLQKYSSSSSEIVASVLSGKWDCGFIVYPGNADRLTGIPVYRDSIGLGIAYDHPLARRRKISISDLRDEPLIATARERNTGFRNWFVERCGAVGVSPRIVQEVSNPLEGWFLASQHAGLALMPRSACKNLPKGSAVFRPFCESDLCAEIRLVHLDERQSPLLAKFISSIERMAERIRHIEPEKGLICISAISRPKVSSGKHAPSHSGQRAISA